MCAAWVYSSLKAFSCFNSVLLARLCLLRLELVLMSLNISSCVMVSIFRLVSRCLVAWLKSRSKSLIASGLSHVVLSEACLSRCDTG